MRFIRDIFCLNNKFAIYNFVSRNLKLKYRKSVLGILWTILIPAATAIVYYFVFQFVMRVPIDNYLLFILSGIIPWTFFQVAILGGLDSIVGNHAILNKVPISANIFPLSDSISALINMLFSIPVLLLVAILMGKPPTIHWLQLPFLVFALALQAYSIGLACGTLFVFFRDLRPIMALVMQIWFYLTPVVYSAKMIPEKYSWVIYINPVSIIFSGFHRITTDRYIIQPSEYLIVFIWTVFIFLSSAIIFNSNRSHLTERL